MDLIVSPLLALFFAFQSAFLVMPLAASAEAPTTAARATEARAAPTPVVTEIRIGKRAHRLELVAGKTVVRSYAVAIGSGGKGHKQFEGDKTTPIGTYKVNGRFKGLFHQFLVVSYPNDEDRARFAALKAKGEVPAGRSVGFGIGIHGVGGKEFAGVHKENDWTHGCIALDDSEIDEVASLVKDGTRIVITE